MTPAQPSPSPSPTFRRLALVLLLGAAAACAGGGSTRPQCEDGDDNDGDGLVDLDDPACRDGRDTEAEDPRTDCNDGDDDDGDGLVDLDDPGCTDIGDDSELDNPVPACGDGVDNDEDGLVDYPADPGCFSALQDSEDDDCPDGPSCPECGNGIDDDEDGQADYPDDSGCAAASDDQERTADPTACAGITFEPLPAGGVTSGSLAATASQITSTTCGGSGAEKVYELYVGDPAVLVATTDLATTTVDTVLYVRERCGDPDTELECNDDADAGSSGSTITVSLDPGYYYLVVDGHDSAAVGNFQLQVELFPGEGSACDPADEAPCAPGLVCRTLEGASMPTCEPPVCSDGVDDDGDGVADYPADPGCAGPGDADETDDCPDGASCPACGNGVDDDGDGQTDYPADTGCASAGQLIEGCADEQDPIVAINDDMLSGTTTGASDDYDPSCGSSGGVDVAHLLDLPVPVTTLVVDTIGSSFDTLVYVDEASCDGTALGCNDDGGGSGTSRLTLSNVAAGAYVVYVDGYSSSYSGAYVLNVHGTVAANTACTDPLFTAGVLACPSTHPCNGQICAPPACGDTIDQDGDGHVGFPDDPGCTSDLDATETDDCPDGANCPACSNDDDDDGDGLVDYPEDPNCASASGSTEACADADPIQAITQPTHTGSTTGLTGNFSASCTSSGSAPDQVWTLSLPADVTSLRLDTIGSEFDTVLMVKTAACEATDLACNDEGGGSGTSLITMTNPAAGNYAVVVDGWSTSSGNYTLNVRGTVAEGAACTSPLFASGVLACPTGHACNGSVCAPAACNDNVDADGDGKVGYPSDPGCTSVSDGTEEDDCPTGAGCPRCGNGQDDDGDGLIDFPLDPSCPAASTDDESGCASANDPYPPITQSVVTGNLDTEGNDFSPSCITSSGRDLAYQLTVPYPLQQLYIDTNGSAVNTVVAVRADGCSGADLACDNNSGDDKSDALLVLSNVAPGEYAVILDSPSSSAGAYTMQVRGIVGEGGTCDTADVATGLYTCAAHTRCTGPAGNQLCTPLACADGVDNDGDGKADAMDAGCLSGADDSEADPATMPQCADVVDNDGDGLTDYPGDNGCRRAADPLELLCAETTGIPEITTPLIAASTAGAGDNFDPGCVSNSDAPERVYAITIPGEMSSLVFDASYSVTGSHDSVLYVRRDDCTTDVACGDNPQLTMTNAAPGTYFVFVDGWSTNEGNFLLGVRGTIAAGQACDPAQIEAGMFTCAAGTTCANNVCQ